MGLKRQAGGWTQFTRRCFWRWTMRLFSRGRGEGRRLRVYVSTEQHRASGTDGVLRGHDVGSDAARTPRRRAGSGRGRELPSLRRTGGHDRVRGAARVPGRNDRLADETDADHRGRIHHPYRRRRSGHHGKKSDRNENTGAPTAGSRRC
ncbi:hypothetical protein BN903_63 [Halorubrum sp. AJ67]|nr:hypothetical protein BN903_63 [Halorubrum sp. AJ67]